MINGFIMIQAKKYAKNFQKRSHKILNVSAKGRKNEIGRLENKNMRKLLGNGVEYFLEMNVVGYLKI